VCLTHKHSKYLNESFTPDTAEVYTNQQFSREHHDMTCTTLNCLMIFMHIMLSPSYLGDRDLDPCGLLEKLRRRGGGLLDRDLPPPPRAPPGERDRDRDRERESDLPPP